ncbi:LacI family DNA-binding transcriptional regulator [Thalassotalea agarivorans]|uniref:Transcriptional regulator, LacI family n=1 Tax=Thalassotalea agarivorans TaxID=349064 RepID=A0A1I0BVP5_THASX|nr:LacI family DNA-binding transcriptional regulator [Thalassotalea agarivorans]SET11023.1 transcriptional regulator, LacI family [Thalassotalea agarivorans]
MKSKITSFDIAYKAGVSQSTVSRALRNSPLVNEETRLKVQAIARELNYKVDKNASNLRSQQSGTIALLLFEDPTNDDSMINPFFLAMLGSITRACANAGYDLLVSFQQMANDWYADYEDTHKADGIILLGYGDFVDYEEKLKQLIEQNTHFVRWGSEVKHLPVVSVGCDNFLGGYDATNHLIKLGKQHIAFIGEASEHAPEFQDRYLGHCRALDDAAIGHPESLQIDAVSTEDSGYQAMKELLESDTKVDAVFGSSDLIAIGAMKAIHDHGLKVPNDIAVVGFDDIPISGYTYPPLTTAKQDTTLAGELLVDHLLKMIGGEMVGTTLMPTTMVVRKSCGAA